MPFALQGVTLELAGRPVLRDVTLSLSSGARVVVLGVNGCGKTTLLKALDGLLFPSAGTIAYDGEHLTAKRLDQVDFRRRFRSEVALLFQNVDAMLFNPTVADEIAFGPRQLGLTDVDARVEKWAEAFDVMGLLRRPPFELSGGEKKRVAIAAIMAIEPKVLLLDEPTANLDPATAARLVEFLAGLTGVTVVVSTQNLTIVEEFGSRAVLLAPGRPGVLFDGPASALVGDQALLIESGLAHRHRGGLSGSQHFHVHSE